MSTTSDGKPLLPTLAGLRFFFALWVLFDHTYNFGPAARAIPMPTLSGLVAVLCFFAISGFSIRVSIEKERSGYYRRRFWRIAPVSVTAVVLMFLSYLIVGHIFDGGGREYPMPSAGLWISYLLLVQVFVLPSYIDTLFPMWSLSIEAVYYSMAPVLRRVPVAGITAFIATSALLFAVFPTLGLGDIKDLPNGLQLVAFFWSWLTGWLCVSHQRNWVVAGLALITGGIFIASQPGPFWLVNWTSIVATYAAWIGTVTLMFFPPRFRWTPRTTKVLDYLGGLSYPLYLIHYPILFTLASTAFRARPEWNYGIVHVAASLIGAVLVFHFIDMPVRRWGTSLRGRVGEVKGVGSAPSSGD